VGDLRALLSHYDALREECDALRASEEAAMDELSAERASAVAHLDAHAMKLQDPHAVGMILLGARDLEAGVHRGKA
jgi:hypothetical protein